MGEGFEGGTIEPLELYFFWVVFFLLFEIVVVVGRLFIVQIVVTPLIMARRVDLGGILKEIKVLFIVFLVMFVVVLFLEDHNSVLWFWFLVVSVCQG